MSAVLGVAAATGQTPVATLVLLARICAMSGNVRVGLAVVTFSPLEPYKRVLLSLTTACTPNGRNSGPLSLLLLIRPVPMAAPRSFCSHMKLSASSPDAVALPVRVNGVRTGMV